MTEHIGTFLGHVLPGTLFLLGGLWWYRSGRPASTPYTTSAEAWVVLTAALLSGIGELWWASWLMTDSSVSNYQHATMYVCFAVPALCHLLAVRGRVSARLPSLTLGGAFAATGGLFIAHGSHMAVSGTLHSLLALLLFACAAVAVAEAFRPSAALAGARCWLTIATGAWFWVVAMVLYRSSYDMNGAGVVMRMHLLFIWNLLAVGALLLAVHVLRRGGSPPATR